MSTQNPPTKRILLIYAGWSLLWVGIQGYLLHDQGFGWGISLADAAVTQLALSVSGYAINTALRFYQPRQMITSIFSWSVALAILCILVQRWALTYLMSGQPEYQDFLKRSTVIRGAFDWLMISFNTVTSWMWFYVNDRQENERQQEHSERLAREAELSDLRNQLQPHFLFNSLNSISALIVSSPELARTMIQQLSDFLRGTVRKDSRQLVTLADELKHLALYLEIEKIRFGDRLTTDIRCDEKSLSASIPSLLLQPIVENAIKFGLYDTVGKITISMVAGSEPNYLIIEIRNPFDEDTSGARKGTGFGLNSIRRRLYLTYSQNDLLSTAKNNNEFSTIIKIPQLT